MFSIVFGVLLLYIVLSLVYTVICSTKSFFVILGFLLGCAATLIMTYWVLVAL